MDICFNAFRGETTGRMVSDGVEPAARTSAALSAATGLAYALGDFCWPGTWFFMTVARRVRLAAEVHDVAA